MNVERFLLAMAVLALFGLSILIIRLNPSFVRRRLFLLGLIIATQDLALASGAAAANLDLQSALKGGRVDVCGPGCHCGSAQ
jgi:hypothetical protein